MKIARPTNRKELRSFIRLVNYYRDVWKRRSEILAPLKELMSEKANGRGMKNTNKHLNKWKKVISQDSKTIAFYLWKLNWVQTRYTTTKKELLAIVETLKEFKNIILGQKIVVYTNHNNLTYKTHNSARVLRWRLII